MSRFSLIRHPSASSFLDSAQGFLVSREAENVLLLGIAWALAQDDSTGAASSAISSAHLFTVESASTVIMAALQTPPYQLVVSRGAEPAVDALVDGLSGEGLPLPGVNGPAETARAFAEKWTKLAGETPLPGMSLRVHQLTRVIPPPEPPGTFRAARPSDIPVLIEWAEAFATETGVDKAGRRPGRADVEARVAATQVYLWDNRGPVSMAGWSGATPSGVRVTWVYTPQELRGRGYASVCVAALSELLLGGGRSFCALYTDLANPISNRLYRRIGYEPVSDFAEYRFHETGD